MSLNNLKKSDLKLLAEKLKGTVPDNSKIFVLKNIIEKSEIFQTDQAFSVENKSIVKEQKAKANFEQSRLEGLKKIKLAQLEKEIELQKFKKQSLPNEQTNTQLRIETN
ncbi:uncharacterized protein NPIL_400731 [Nephila pilipes]|uniref:Uncharacterized protein n=1 Tax=Nephila pilipes TaxID=299642 RepID=A0A8X6NQX2_NEPPI|nr:uncharacterized protein NPIL_400731 [Nephila pilipes]